MGTNYNLKFMVLDIKNSKIYLAIIISFLLVSTETTLADDPTIWGPGKDYVITYIHSSKLELNGSTLEEEKNLPVTEVGMDHLENDLYRFTYIGYGNTSFTSEISFIPVPELAEAYIPINGIPIILPLSYKGSDTWVSKFAHDLLSINLERKYSQGMSKLITDNFTTQGNILTFNSFFQVSPSELNLQNYYLPPLRSSKINESITNSNVTGKLSYSLQTGVIFSLDIYIQNNDFITASLQNLGSFSSLQTIEFVAIIPPILFIDGLLNLNTILVVSLIIAYFIARKRR